MKILAAALVALLTVSPSTPDADLERALAVLAHVDAAIVSVEFGGVTLAQVMETLGAKSEYPLRVDWNALDLYRISPRDVISLELNSVRLSTALAAVCMQLGDDFERPVVEAAAGHLVLTTVDSTARMTMTDVYDVRDLLAGDDVLDHLLETVPQIDADDPSASDDDLEETENAQENDDKFDDGGGKLPIGGSLPPIDVDSTRAPAGPKTRSATLMSLIVDHIDPEAWEDLGGDRAHYAERDGIVVITAPPSLHRKLRDAFARLRRAYFTAVSIEAGIVDLPRAEFVRIARRYDRSSAALARAVLSKAGDGPLWQLSVAIALGATGTVETESKTANIKLTLEPTFDRESGILSIKVAASSKHGDDRRQVKTTVTIPFRDGGAVIELPAADAGDRVRLLLLVPKRM